MSQGTKCEPNKDLEFKIINKSSLVLNKLVSTNF